MHRLTVLFIPIVSMISVEAQSQSTIKVTVVNAASFQPGLPTGGALGTIFASGVTGLTPGTYVAPPSGSLPMLLNGFGILINGAQAPILAVVVPSDPTASVQINFQVPLERNATLGNLGVKANGYLIAFGQTVTPLPDPGLGGFFAAANGYAIAVHASDSSLVTVQNPAHAGETIIAYADDFFGVWPPPPIGYATPAQPSFPLTKGLLPGVTFFSGSYLYVGPYASNPTCGPVPGCGSFYQYTRTPAVPIDGQSLAPNMTGIEQIVFTLPANQPPGNWPLFFNAGSCPDGSGGPCVGQLPGSFSSPYVTLPVK